MPAPGMPSVAAISRIDAIPAILKVVCETTRLRCAAVARVSEGRWTACAVLDNIGLGLKAGDELDLAKTLCLKVRDGNEPVVISHASEDPCYRENRIPKMYGFEAYLSFPIYRTDGKFFGTLCALDPVPGDMHQPQIAGMMASFAHLIALQLDMDESRLQTEATLHEERQTAQLREQFITTVGHDLRNPLTAVTTASQVLSAMPLDARSQQLVAHINRSAFRATALVGDLLDFERGRLGLGIPLRRERCALAEHLHHVIDELRHANPKRTIHVDLDPIPVFECDSARIMQLLSNLLSNALIHGDHEGPVDVVAECQDDTLQLRVSNIGTPIAKRDIPRLFEPYWRGDPKRPRSGLGVGLFIARQIALSHGGRLDVSSSAAQGTTFTCVLPLAEHARPCKVAD